VRVCDDEGMQGMWLVVLVVVILISRSHPHSFHVTNEYPTSLSLPFCKALLLGFVQATFHTLLYTLLGFSSQSAASASCECIPETP
jgi:hypothetical protein